ncbi:hypothetical protein BV898_06354 [Hypsibius exemplaris]|uniref:Uncharacterized protein n=1 Tax=Hypsibius exemplaris TaxID=2072580 RepID=A0A1W0WWL1_HYPEX|nr:hypothetical protein BV898_06354 [Hypsibius exemplaris]
MLMKIYRTFRRMISNSGGKVYHQLWYVSYAIRRALPDILTHKADDAIRMFQHCQVVLPKRPISVLDQLELRENEKPPKLQNILHTSSPGTQSGRADYRNASGSTPRPEEVPTKFHLVKPLLLRVPLQS